MKIYAQEKKDGLDSQMKSEASIALTCGVLTNSDHGTDETALAKILASGPSNPDQRDLYYLNSVLVSTGWNKNDDVFDTEEVWAARHTPVDKQFNVMHNENDIIGHITGSIVLDRDSNDVTDQESPPEEFDIVTSAVVYTSWSDEDQKERVSKLTEEIDQGKWAVSMECLFNDFDYAVVTPDGKQRVIARNEQSAFLTKHLRSYGGTGEFHDFKLGRQLKSITFSGKGLVDNPANPRSIILDKETDPFKAKSSLSINSLPMENTMDLETLKAENQSLREKLERVTLDAVAAAKVDADVKITDLEAVASEKDAAIAGLNDTITSLTEQNEAKHKENEDFKDKFEKMKKEKKDEKRKASLIEAGLSLEDATARFEKFADISDEAFAEIVSMIADTQKKLAEAAKVETVEEVTVADEDDSAEAVADVESVEDLETSEASLTVTEDPEDDQRQKSVAATAKWIEESVLNLTSK